MLAHLIVIAAVATNDPPLHSNAEPYLAIRTGMRCSQCHVNRAGGGGRTDFGAAYGQTVLPARPEEFVSRAISDFLSFGVDFRARFDATVTPSTPRTTLGVDQANIYLEARLLSDAVTVYIDQSVGASRSQSREVFGLLEGLPFGAYAKVGKFVLPYGLRLQDDEEFIRERTGFTFESPDQGFEIGIEPGRFTWIVSVTNGAGGSVENDSEKQVTTTVYYAGRRFRLGGAASHNGGTASRDVVGGFGGVNVGRITALGEFDFIFDDSAVSGDSDQFAAFGELDVLAAPGINAKFTYGYLDPDRGVPENERVRVRLGLEIFPRPFVRVAAFFTIVEDIPQAVSDTDRIGLELHLYF